MPPGRRRHDERLWSEHRSEASIWLFGVITGLLKKLKVMVGQMVGGDHILKEIQSTTILVSGGIPLSLPPCSSLSIPYVSAKRF